MKVIACEVHGYKVLADDDGTLRGTCQGCMYEVAKGLRDIADGVWEPQLWARNVLACYR